MIKNGWLYSDENGYEDAGLITDHSQEEIALVRNWIDANIYPRRTIFPDYKSYGIKNIVVDAKNYSQRVTKKEVLQIVNYLKYHGTVFIEW